MKRIHDIVEKIKFYQGNKETGFNSPHVIVRELNVESLNVFNDLHDEYARTRKISEFLQPFMRTEKVDIIDSIGVKPIGFAHATGAYLETGFEAEIIETAVWVNRLQHPNKVPDGSYPIIRMIGNNIEVRPSNISKIQLDFLKLPTEAVYSFTIDGDDYVYDDESSVDWEWSKYMEDRIINRALTNLGVNVKDRDLINVSQTEKMQE